MPYNSSILPSIYGRRVGLQELSSGQSGGSKGPGEFLVGPEDIRIGVTTNETTGTPINAWGLSNLIGTSVASTPVYSISPPIPGIRKTVNFGSTDSALYLKAASGVSFSGTSLGSTGATVIRSSGGGCVDLMGVSTSVFAVLSVSSSAVNALEFQATT